MLELPSMSNETPRRAPPLGIVPRAIWEDKHWSEHQGPPTLESEGRRLVELAWAINRHVATGLPVPIEWLKEVRAITATIDNSRAAACRTSPPAPLMITSQAELDAAYGKGFGTMPRREGAVLVTSTPAADPREPPVEAFADPFDFCG